MTTDLQRGFRTDMSPCMRRIDEYTRREAGHADCMGNELQRDSDNQSCSLRIPTDRKDERPGRYWLDSVSRDPEKGLVG